MCLADRQCVSGAIVAPPVPALYLRPQTVDQLIDHTVARVLDLFEIDVGMPRWGEPPDPEVAALPPGMAVLVRGGG